MENEACVFENGKNCTILTKKQCGNCSFFKTEEEYQKHKEKSAERFERLSFDRRKEICDKYNLTVAEAAPKVEEKEKQDNAD